MLLDSGCCWLRAKFSKIVSSFACKLTFSSVEMEHNRRVNCWCLGLHGSGNRFFVKHIEKGKKAFWGGKKDVFPNIQTLCLMRKPGSLRSCGNRCYLTCEFFFNQFCWQPNTKAKSERCWPTELVLPRTEATLRFSSCYIRSSSCFWKWLSRVVPV